MKKHNFIEMTVFVAKHELNRNSFDSMRSQGYYPRHAFVKHKPHATLYVDENYFLHRHAKIRRIWDKAQQNYYILSENMSDYKIAKMLCNIDASRSLDSWAGFLRDGLFAGPHLSLARQRIPRGLYLFLRYSNWLLKKRSGMSDEVTT